MSDEEDRESGPFCPHWHATYECDVMCKCGHECWRHDNIMPGGRNPEEGDVVGKCDVGFCPCTQLS